MQKLQAEEAELVRQLEETTYFSDGIVVWQNLSIKTCS